MDAKTEKLLAVAHDARYLLAIGKIDYDEAIRIVKRYTNHANEKAKLIAKRFGRKFEPINPRAFLR